VTQPARGVALLIAAAVGGHGVLPLGRIGMLQPRLEDQARRVRIDVLAPNTSPARTRAARITQVRLGGGRGQALIH
jgi:hypothetical protein